MVTPAKTLPLLVPKAPNLPNSTPSNYDQAFQNQILNVLRLYFNQLDNFDTGIGQIIGTSTGGSTISFPYGAFHQDGVTALTVAMTNSSTSAITVTSTAAFPSSGYLLIGSEIVGYTSTTPTTFVGITRGVLGTTNVAHVAGVAISEVQGTGSSTTIGKMLFNNTDASNGVAADSTDQTKIVFTYPGRYNVQFSVQLLSFSNNADNVTIWVRQNGVDIPASAGIVTVPAIHGGVPGATIAGWNYILYVNQNDYLQFYWTTDSGNSVVATYPPGTTPVHPSSPAMFLTAQFVSS